MYQLKIWYVWLDNFIVKDMEHLSVFNKSMRSIYWCVNMQVFGMKTRWQYRFTIIVDMNYIL